MKNKTQPARCATTTRRPDDARGVTLLRCERARNHSGAHEVHYIRLDDHKRTLFWMTRGST